VSSHTYQHQDLKTQVINLPVGKVVCVGRNYMAHIQELNNAVPEQALLFIKPSTALCSLSAPLFIPKDHGSCHHEVEIGVLLQQGLTKASPKQAQEAIWGYGLALDLTLRDLQDELKSKGHPWERAKAFDGSCPMSGFVPAADVPAPGKLEFSLQVNGHPRQQGCSGSMMRDVISLLVEISQTFTLLPGDIVLTGTPEGVAELKKNDKLSLSLAGYFLLNTEVV
jgi:2-keto-4-pentenoate hydratase/2-oxohepta-3-ene-1,7-dioic acid hydratase in catechol pathway